jgi:tripartite-type tricarboxylate transporter receptor subunit TctC
VVVENRDGAGGSIGTTLAAKSPNDGYTILMAPTTLTVSPALQATRRTIRCATLRRSPGRDPADVDRDEPRRAVQQPEGAAGVRQGEPGKLSYGTSGKGSPSHLEMEMINSMMGTKMQDVPYKSFGSAISDTISGQVSFYFPTFPAALPPHQGGQGEAAGGRQPERAPQAPNIPPSPRSWGNRATR